MLQRLHRLTRTICLVSVQDRRLPQLLSRVPSRLLRLLSRVLRLVSRVLQDRLQLLEIKKMQKKYVIYLVVSNKSRTFALALKQ